MSEMAEQDRKRFNRFIDKAAMKIMVGIVSSQNLSSLRNEEVRKFAAERAYECAQALWAEWQVWRISSPEENAKTSAEWEAHMRENLQRA